MLYIAIPAHNEADTIGVLLWRLRTVLAEFPREYEIIVYDDASNDATQDVLASYTRVLPLSILRGTTQVGYARAVDALLRHVVRQTRHPRRDAVLLLQADFTDPPGLIPEFARRFEGGADLVIGERRVLADAPRAVSRLFRFSGWSMRPFVRVDGIHDVTSSLRLLRIALVRDLLRERGDAALCEGDTWTANADLLLNLVPFARRIESVPVQPTYGVRMRETRRIAMRDGLAAFKWAWRARKRRVSALASLDQEPTRRDEARLTLTRVDDDERPARGRDRESRDGRERERFPDATGERPREKRERPVREPRRSVARGEARRSTSDTDAAPPAPDKVALTGTRLTAIDGNAAALDRSADTEGDALERKRKRKRRSKRSSRDRSASSALDVLALIDPAAGPVREVDDDDDDEDFVRSEGDQLRPSENRDEVQERIASTDIDDANADRDEGDESAGDSTAPADAERVRKRRRRRKRSRGNSLRGTEVAGEEVERPRVDDADLGEDPYAPDASPVDGDDIDNPGSGDVNDDSSAARSRRRGRRGRRGGRRSRRGSGNGGAAGDASAGTEDSAGPSTHDDSRSDNFESPDE